MKYSKYEKIVELSNLISSQKLNSFNLFDQEKKDSKIKLLYHLSSNEKKEDQVIKLLGYEKNNSAYLKLKDRLLKKLYSSLFFLDTSSNIFSSLGLEFYKLQKTLFQHRVLLQLNKLDLSYDVIETDIRSAIKYEFPDIVIQLARPARQYFGFINPDQKKFIYYDQLIEDYLRKYEAELLTEKYYSILSYNYKIKKSDERILLGIIDEYLEKIESYSDLEETFRKTLYKYQITSFKYQLLKDFNRVVELSDKTISYFKNKPYSSYLITYFISVDQTTALLKLNKINQALVGINELEAIYEKGHFNWFKIQSLKFSAYLLLKNYNKIYDITKEVIGIKKLQQYKGHHQFWLIKDAYINFLLRMGKINLEEKENQKNKTFRLGKFLNEVPLFSNDKRGLNISILILQMLFYLLDRKFGKFIDRMDALNQYSYRYLRNDETLRSNCFVKMILKIPDANYHPVAVQRHVQKYHKKLLSTTQEISEQSAEIEIIPYENLWEMVLELLEKIKN